MDVDLNADNTVQLDGSGKGQIALGPTSPGEIWTVTQIAVKVSTPVTNEAACNIYNGDRPTDPNFIDGTFSGSSGDATDKCGPPLTLGNYIYAVWTGGDAAHVASLNITGTRSIP